MDIESTDQRQGVLALGVQFQLDPGLVRLDAVIRDDQDGAGQLRVFAPGKGLLDKPIRTFNVRLPRWEGPKPVITAQDVGNELDEHVRLGITLAELANALFDLALGIAVTNPDCWTPPLYET